MAAYRRVYDSHHLQADCQEPGSAPEPYARQSSMGYFTLPLLDPPLSGRPVITLYAYVTGGWTAVETMA